MEKGKIGENAGKVWHTLNEMEEISIHELCRKTALTFEDAALAVGWLARENKIFLHKKLNMLYISNGCKVGFSFG